MKTPPLFLSAVVGFIALVALGVYLQPVEPVPAAAYGAQPAPAAPVAEAPAEPTHAPTVAPTPVPPKPAPTRGPYPTFAPSAPVQREPAGPTGGKCADYASQAEAQAALRRDPVQAGRLDDDRDGIACESNPAPFDRAPVARPARP